MLATNQLRAPSNTHYRQLSKREAECLLLTIRGKSARQLGLMLGISQRTVEEYLNNVKAKFGVSSKSQLIEVTVNELIKHFL